jgi:hypothetical protein
MPRRHKRYYAPSWSWASIIGHVLFPTVWRRTDGQDDEPQHEQKILYVSIKDISVVQNPTDPYEAPLNASIIAFGRLASLKISEIKAVEDPRRLKVICRNEAGKPVLSRLEIELDVTEAPWEVSESELIHLLLCASTWKSDPTLDSSKYKTDTFNFEGIVLRDTRTSDYERIGYFRTFTHLNKTNEYDNAIVAGWERFWFSETREQAVKII